MSCFWDGILDSMKPKVFKAFGFKKKPTHESLIGYFKRNNVEVSSILYNGNELSEREIKENYDWIKNYKPKTFNDGTDCSASNPFLFLYCHLFGASVIHHYYGTEIRYENTENSLRVVTFMSNIDHFWFDNEQITDAVALRDEIRKHKKKKNKKK